MLLKLKLHGTIAGLGFEKRGQRPVKLVDMATTIMNRTRLECDLKRISVGITEIGFGCNYISLQWDCGLVCLMIRRCFSHAP